MDDNRELTGEERQLFEIIISELESKDQNVRDAAIVRLEQMGASAYAPDARAKLGAYIEGPDEYQGRDAIDAMVAIGDEYVVDYLRLVALKKNPNQYLRSRSAYALGQIGDVRAIPDLTEALQDPSWSNVVPAAKWALNKLYAKKDK